jgi:hypothetical protein
MPPARPLGGLYVASRRKYGVGLGPDGRASVFTSNLVSPPARRWDLSWHLARRGLAGGLAGAASSRAVQGGRGLAGRVIPGGGGPTTGAGSGELSVSVLRGCDQVTVEGVTK